MIIEGDLTLGACYGAFKEWLSIWSGMPEDLLHVHMGLFIFVFFAIALRRRMHSVWPVSAVAFLALLNEVIDSFATDWDPALSALDILNTVLWPTVLFLVARRSWILPPLGGSMGKIAKAAQPDSPP